MSHQSSGDETRGGSLTRRGVLGAAAAAMLVTPLLTSSRGGAAVDHLRDARSRKAEVLALLYPLREGTTLGRWRVVKMHSGPQAGAFVVEMSDERGRRFQVDICRRDDSPGALIPPARTAKCDLLISNGGQGAQATDELQGLAVMALADLIRTNEHSLDLGDLVTPRQRLRSHREEVVRHV